MSKNVITCNRIAHDIKYIVIAETDSDVSYFIERFLIQPDNHIIVYTANKLLLNTEKKHNMYMYTDGQRYFCGEIDIDIVNFVYGVHLIRCNEVVKSDRRKLSRVDCNYTGNINFGFYSYDCTILNISGGGVLCEIHDSVKYKRAILKFNIDKQEINIMVRVCDIKKQKNKVKLHLEFLDVTEGDRSKIIKEVYKLQVERNKNKN